MHEVGRMPEISAKVIQRAFRRYLFKEKIKRLSVAYENYMISKIEAKYLNVKNKIRNLACVWIVKTTKYEVFKAKKLKKIRENLALMAIKYFLKNKKLRLKGLTEKIKKYKRRKKAAIKRMKRIRQALGDYNSEITENSLNFVSFDSGEDFETTTSDREAIEREKLLKKLEQERRIKIALGKISYNYREFKLPKLKTSLQLSEILSPSPLSLSMKVKESKNFRKVESIKNKNFKKKRFSLEKNEVEEPSYMKETLSFSRSRYNAKQNCFSESPRLKKDSKKPFKNSKKQLSKVTMPTQSSLLKSRKRSISPDRMNQRDSVFLTPKLEFYKEKPLNNQKISLKGLKTPPKLSISLNFPDISTHYSKFVRKLKPRASIMRGFLKQKRVSDSFLII